ncbi:acetyl-CoA carboxylase [Tanacetum coccineum]
MFRLRNPVKEILLKLNLPDHRILKDGGEVKEFQRSFHHFDTERLSRSNEVLKLKNFKKDATLKLSKSTNQGWYEHVGPEVTRSQDDKGDMNPFEETCSHFPDPVLWNHFEEHPLADLTDNGPALHSRDCSVQRRHQKIVEEGLITVAPQETIKKLEQAARRLAKSVNYDGVPFAMAQTAHDGLQLEDQIVKFRDVEYGDNLLPKLASEAQKNQYASYETKDFNQLGCQT